MNQVNNDMIQALLNVGTDTSGEQKLSGKALREYRKKRKTRFHERVEEKIVRTIAQRLQIGKLIL